MTRLTLLRHATLLLELAGSTVLIDPMLAEAETLPAVPDTANPRRNPLVGLPVPAEEIVRRADVVCATHLHVDHFDTVAMDLVREAGLPVLCQHPDEPRLRELGFEQVVPVEQTVEWRGMEVTRTGGQHGTGRLAEIMAPVSGFVFAVEGQRVYVAGDTIWCEDVRAALAEHRPTVVVVNAGEARMLEGDPITMDADDVVAVARAAEPGQVAAVHMEAINHCGLSREQLAAKLAEAGVSAAIPADGETWIR